MRTAIGAFLLSLFGFASTFGQNVAVETEVEVDQKLPVSLQKRLTFTGKQLHVRPGPRREG